MRQSKKAALLSKKERVVERGLHLDQRCREPRRKE
jgi:hypothetical protein